MSVCLAHIVTFNAVVISQLQHGMVFLITIADKRQREFAIRIIVLTQHFHAQYFCIKLD
ncbi:hypothetical protein D3C84_1306930 [compost metagenome]